MGGGDVKLIAATALWAGLPMVLEFVLLTTIIGGAIAIFMVTQWRFTLAQVCEFVGGESIRDVFLGRSIPYAIAIAAAAYLTVGTALLSG
jgi:prepilin peptidase CpaA